MPESCERARNHRLGALTRSRVGAEVARVVVHIRAPVRSQVRAHCIHVAGAIGDVLEHAERHNCIGGFEPRLVGRHVRKLGKRKKPLRLLDRAARRIDAGVLDVRVAPQQLDEVPSVPAPEIDDSKRPLDAPNRLVDELQAVELRRVPVRERRHAARIFGG